MGNEENQNYLYILSGYQKNLRYLENCCNNSGDLEDEFVSKIKANPDLGNSSLSLFLPLAIATSELCKVKNAFVDCCFRSGGECDVAAQGLIDAQKVFVNAKTEYENKIGRKLNNDKVSVLKEFEYCLTQEKERLLKEIRSCVVKLQQEKALNSDELLLRDEVVSADDLPDKICIGALENSCELSYERLINSDINDLIAECSNHSLLVDIKNKGNVIINASRDSRKEDKIYDYICNIVLKYYDSFPIGALRVHFVDSQKDMRFEKFVQGFQEGNTSEKTRLAVELVDEYDSIVEKLENKCNDTASKLVRGVNDVYDLYKIDNNECIDLVVIRNGFADIAKSGGRNEFQKLVDDICSERNRRGGIRYIIVNDVCADDFRFDEEIKKRVESIVSAANIVVDYSNDEFRYNNKAVVPLGIDCGINEEKFIESKCSKIGTALAKKAGKIIAYEELGCFDMRSAPLSAVVEIPVGKSGSEIISIPFSCADIDNSDAAKNIGLMVLGQSGSGKSSLYHSIIINGSMKYSPSDLQFWLLDFKNNSSAGMYSATDNNIPHIKIVAPNSKRIDAYNILRNMIDEMQYRLDRFNEIGNKYGVKLSNVLEYNQFIEKERINDCPHMPRIILMIDEAQELFRDAKDGSSDELPKQIGTFINKLVSLGRSSGIHMAIFAQNLESQTYILKDNFINQLKCKVCFRLSSSSVTNSGFKGEFDKRKDEIEALGTGEIYLSYSNTEIKKCKVAHAEDVKLIDHLGSIVKKYGSFSSSVLKIGVTDRLSALDIIPNTNQRYIDKIMSACIKKEKIVCAIGENAYSLRAENIIFEPTRISSVFLVGNSRSVAMSLFATLLIATERVGCDIRICNGMQREDNFYNTLLGRGLISTAKYNLYDIDKCVGELYVEYKKRKLAEQKTGEFDTTPIVLFLNDFDGAEKLQQDIEICLGGQPVEQRQDAKSLRDIMNREKPAETASESKTDAKNLLNGIRLKKALEELLKSASQYNIYLVVLLKETYYREFDDALKSSGNVIIFNETDYQTVANNYVAKDTLKDIRQRKSARSMNSVDDEDDTETDNESFAILFRKKEYLKFRPVIYRAGDESEEEKIIKILKDKNNE